MYNLKDSQRLMIPLSVQMTYSYFCEIQMRLLIKVISKICIKKFIIMNTIRSLKCKV